MVTKFRIVNHWETKAFICSSIYLFAILLSIHPSIYLMFHNLV